MTNKKITVLGALGTQGGSVVKSLLDDGNFDITAVTRSVDSDAAKTLKDKGVKIVSGNTKDPDTLLDAFTDADAAFIVVNFWDPEIMGKELDLTKKIMDVAKKANVKHVIYSSLANVETVSDGKLDVPHFTMKAKAYEYAKTLNFQYLTSVEVPFYYTNWFTFFKPTTEDDGTLVWTFPGKNKISMGDSSTGTGPSTVAVAKDPEKYNGKYILIEGDCLTPEESITLIGKKMNKSTKVNFVEPSVFATFFPGAKEVAEMVQWFDEYEYFGPETDDRKHSSGKDAGGTIMSFEAWLDTKAYEKLLE